MANEPDVVIHAKSTPDEAEQRDLPGFGRTFLVKVVGAGFIKLSVPAAPLLDPQGDVPIRGEGVTRIGAEDIAIAENLRIGPDAVEEPGR
jgi:hypothetical protein